MSLNSSFKIALCLLAVWVVAINCDPQLSIDVDRTFFANHTVGGKKGTSEIECTPQDLCDKVKFTDVVCKAKVPLPVPEDQSTIPYTCSSDQYTNTKEKVTWSYKVSCLKDEPKKEALPKEGEQPPCSVQITLTPQKGSKAGLIIGIIILVIAVAIGVVAGLGYKGIGPMASVFNK